MDSPTDWAATMQFSPSKAQAQQAQAKDWASVDAWLSKRYASKRLPAFERNEETLQALLILAAMNENADEQRGHIDRIEKAAFSAHTKRSSATDGTYQTILGELGDIAELDALAHTVMDLNCASVEISAVSAAVVDLTSECFTLEQQARIANSQVSTIKSEQQRLETLLDELKQDAFQAPAGLTEQTSESLRSAKHMRAKVAEYDDRLNGLRPSQQSQVLSDSVIQEAQSLKAHEDHLEELNLYLQAYQSLPANAKAARHKVEGLTENLRSLTAERDRLFERLAGPG